MLTFEKPNNRKNLIIFVHGFIGGRNTWVRDNVSEKSILDYLRNETSISDNFDFAVFDYFTKVSSVMTQVSGWFGFFTGNKVKMARNIPVEDIANELQSEIRYKCDKYEQIVIVAHSMGGLISKSYIVEEIKANKKLPVTLFVSLAVPHRGANLAVYAQLIVDHPQVEDLQPLSDTVNNLNDAWIELSDKLPETIYFLGSYDTIVPKNSAVSSDTREREIVYTQEDHFSIVCPPNNDSVSLKAIIKKCKELLENKDSDKAITDNFKGTNYIREIEQPVNTPKPIRPTTNQDISNPSVMKDELKEKISEEKFKEVFEVLKDLFKNDNDKRNAVFLQSARWNSLKNNIDAGIISYDNSSTERNKIKVALLNLIDEISD